VTLLVLPGAASAISAQPGTPSVTHGVVVGDVTARSAVLWARADRAATLNVTLSGGGHGPVEQVTVEAADDYTGKVVLDRLRPGMTYDYRVWLSLGARGVAHGPAVRGSFRTPPAHNKAATVKLAFGGDVAGQNVCRDAQQGFPIMDTIREWEPDIFVGLGDMIYADNACAAAGRYGNDQLGDLGVAVDLAGFWEHWRYNRADRASQRLLRSTSYIGVWDDHEVVNDFGPLTDAPTAPPYTGAHLLPVGLDAFIDYTPIATVPSDSKRLYRSLRWGRHLELFVLDTRQYAAAVTSWEDAKQWFNFGTLEIAVDGKLIAGIVDTAGRKRFSLELPPS